MLQRYGEQNWVYGFRMVKANLCLMVRKVIITSLENMDMLTTRVTLMAQNSMLPWCVATTEDI